MEKFNAFISQILQAYDPIYSVSGLLIGALVGLTGVGGGSLMTPLLVLVFGVNPATAVGTDLIYAAITKAFGTVVHGKRQSIEWRIVLLLSLGSVPATALTLWLIKEHGQTIEFANLIRLLLGYALIITALMMVGRVHLMRFAKDHYHTGHEKRGAVLTIFTGALIGGLVSLTSVGAGAIGVTALLLLYPKLSTLRIVASDIAHAVPLTLFAGMGYVLLGQVDFALLFSLLVGSIPGIILGSHFAPKIPEKFLRIILAIVLCLVGYKLISK